MATSTILESMSCPSVRPKPRARGTDFPGRMLLLSRTRPPRPVFLVEEIAAEALPSVSCRILRWLGPGLWKNFAAGRHHDLLNALPRSQGAPWVNEWAEKRVGRAGIEKRFAPRTIPCRHEGEKAR